MWTSPATLVYTDGQGLHRLLIWQILQSHTYGHIRSLCAGVLGTDRRATTEVLAMLFDCVRIYGMYTLRQLGFHYWVCWVPLTTSQMSKIPLQSLGIYGVHTTRSKDPTAFCLGASRQSTHGNTVCGVWVQVAWQQAFRYPEPFSRRSLPFTYNMVPSTLGSGGVRVPLLDQF